MAGPSIGTWVKVRNKSGRTTARVIAKKFGGGSYSQGEVITQSEYNSYKDKRADAMKAEASGGGGQARQDKNPQTFARATRGQVPGASIRNIARSAEARRGIAVAQKRLQREEKIGARLDKIERQRVAATEAAKKAKAAGNEAESKKQRAKVKRLVNQRRKLSDQASKPRRGTAFERAFRTNFQAFD